MMSKSFPALLNTRLRLLLKAGWLAAGVCVGAPCLQDCDLNFPITYPVATMHILLILLRWTMLVLLHGNYYQVSIATTRLPQIPLQCVH